MRMKIIVPRFFSILLFPFSLRALAIAGFKRITSEGYNDMDVKINSS